MTNTIVFIISILISAISTPLIISLAKKWGLMDYPGRAHPANIITSPTPRAGGIPILLTLLILVPLFVSAGGVMEPKRILALLFACVLIVIVGTLDDKYDLNPYFRFSVNIISALVIVGSGIAISWVPNPFGSVIRFDQVVVTFDFLGRVVLIPVFADLISLIWLVWMMNAINWSKGVDGQLPGITAIAALILSFVALRYVETDLTQAPVATLSFIVSGAYFGFLPFNMYPQKIMPGYGGGALAGLLLGVLAIVAGGRLAATILVLVVPITDAIFAVLRRVLRGHSPFWGDRGHLHHKLLDLGWSKSQIALFYWALTGATGLGALSLGSKGKSFAIITLIVLISAVLITLFFTSTPKPEKQKKL